MASKMQAYSVALDALEHERNLKGERHAEVYVVDRGLAWARECTPRTRYEAGVLTGVGEVRFRTASVYGESWADLIASLRALPAKRRGESCRSWRLAAFDALAAGANPAEVAQASLQLHEWIRNGSEAQP